ncbi:PfkB family carbohydrate kinase [uncultured Tateyamaria sp.]|uniref:PfkB family carbohydrate kinase n=1 Tax=uncultured Tateyamaria sp. TaxID=455651 RepID=UPI002605E040|nr:PfkB family carbohydrate kinase [uncultured Tateyamaria sp.]
MSVLVVGSLHLDVVLRAPHLPRLDETVTGSGVDYVVGGKGGNQAMAASRMGATVGFAGRIGSDEFGGMIRKALVTSGVDITQLQIDDGSSGMSAAIVEDSGEYGAVIVSAANLRIEPNRIRMPAGTTHVLLQNEVPEVVNIAVARQARKIGAAVWLNAAPARALSSELTEMVDLIIVNRIEAAFYASALPPTKVLTTLGSDGVLFEGNAFPAHKVTIVSAHGAGDMFVGALAAQAAGGTSMPEAIAFAQAAAALQVGTTVAARDALTQNAVHRFTSHQSSL